MTADRLATALELAEEVFTERLSACRVANEGYPHRCVGEVRDLQIVREALAAHRSQSPAEGDALAEVAAFLDGSGALEGVWFGEPHPTKKGAFWWRTNLRAALASQVQPKGTAPEAPKPFAYYVDDEDGEREYNGVQAMSGGRKGSPLFTSRQMHDFAAARFSHGVEVAVEQMSADLDAAQAEVARLKARAPAPAPEVPAENLPTKENIRELAQEALDQIMEQAQVFASAWSLVGGRFDYGNALSEAHDAKDELRSMVRSLADLAAETVRPAQAPAVQDGKEQP